MQTSTIFAVPALPLLPLVVAVALGVAPGLVYAGHSEKEAAALGGPAESAAPGFAQDGDGDGGFGWEDGDQSYDLARRARENGQALILEEIFKRATARFPGRVVDAELESKDGVLVYELKILDRKGRLIKVHLDARHGLVLDKTEEDKD